MSTAPKYASTTTVPPERTRAEIEQTLKRYGADQFAFGWSDNDKAVVQFRVHERVVRFDLPMPDRQAPHIVLRPRSTWERRTDAQQRAAYEQEERSRWRALLVVIKAKLAAVEAQIVTFEDEFMAHILLPNNQTVSEHISPAIDEAYRTGRVSTGMLELGSGEPS